MSLKSGTRLSEMAFCLPWCLRATLLPVTRGVKEEAEQTERGRAEGGGGREKTGREESGTETEGDACRTSGKPRGRTHQRPPPVRRPRGAPRPPAGLTTAAPCPAQVRLRLSLLLEWRSGPAPGLTASSSRNGNPSSAAREGRRPGSWPNAQTAAGQRGPAAGARRPVPRA